MRAPWPIAGSSPEFALRLGAYQQLYWLHVESDFGSSIGGHGVTGGGRCPEGR